VVRCPDFAAAYARRVQIHGGQILLSEKGPKDEITLRLYDILTGKDVWKRPFAAKTLLLRPQETHLAGGVEPDGQVTVMDLRSQKEVLKAKMQPEHLEGVQTIHLLSDRADFYLACRASTDKDLAAFGGVQANLNPASGLRAVPVHGHLYAFDAATGR